MSSYRGFLKKLDLPADFSAPDELKYHDLLARPLGRRDLKADLAAVNSSIKIIQQTRGGSWPNEELEEEFDFLDLAWHEREFRDCDSFAYVIYGSDGNYVGCFYLYPMGHRTLLSEELLEYDVDASWWVTAEAYKHGDYLKLFTAIKDWLTSFPFKKPYFSNQEIPK